MQFLPRLTTAVTIRAASPECHRFVTTSTIFHGCKCAMAAQNLWYIMVPSTPDGPFHCSTVPHQALCRSHPILKPTPLRTSVANVARGSRCVFLGLWGVAPSPVSLGATRHSERPTPSLDLQLDGPNIIVSQNSPFLHQSTQTKHGLNLFVSVCTMYPPRMLHHLENIP